MLVQIRQREPAASRPQSRGFERHCFVERGLPCAARVMPDLPQSIKQQLAVAEFPPDLVEPVVAAWTMFKELDKLDAPECFSNSSAGFSCSA